MVIIKKVNKIYIFFFSRLPFVIKIGWNDFCWSTLCCFAARLSCCVYNLIIRKQWIELSIILSRYLPFPQHHVAGFWIKTFWDTRCSFGFLHLYQYLSLFHFWFKLQFLPWKLHWYLHHICFINVYDSFILIITLKTWRFKFSILFRTHTLLDGSIGELQLLTHLSTFDTSI